MTVTQIATPVGPARAHIHRPTTTPRGTVVLSHGAGGGIDAPDLVALTALVDGGWNYVLVEQPWRVAGKKIAPAPKTLDAAWVPIIAALHDGRRRLTGPWITGGRSAGARVACRTAAATGADGVLAPDEVSNAVPNATVRAAAGDHGFTKIPQDVVAPVRDWLERSAGSFGR